MSENEDILNKNELVVNSPENICTRKFHLDIESWEKLSIMSVSHYIEKNGGNIDNMTKMTSEMLIEIINHYHDNVYSINKG